MKSAIFIVDAFNALFRAQHSTGALTLADGSPCGAAWGATRSVLAAAQKVRRSVQFEGLFVAWDGGRSPRRLAAIPDYKAGRGRSKTPEEREALREAITANAELLRRVLDKLGAVHLDRPGVEADDLIGALARREKSKGREVFILSNDHDFLQLLSPEGGITLIREGVGNVVESGEGSRELLKLAIVGDSSDNIKGIPGIGEKRFEALFEAVAAVAGPESCAMRNSPAEGAASRKVAHGATPAEAAGELLRAANDDGAAERLAAWLHVPTAKLLAKVRANSRTLNRNMAAMDLRRSALWPEVAEALADAAEPGPGSVADFRRMVHGLGWFGLEPFLAGAARLANPGAAETRQRPGKALGGPSAEL